MAKEAEAIREKGAGIIKRPLAKVFFIKFLAGGMPTPQEKMNMSGMGILPVLAIFARGLRMQPNRKPQLSFQKLLNNIPL